MASLEEMMAGLFGDVEARGAQGLGGRMGAPAMDDRDPRRRRSGQDSGFGGIAGGEITLASILPHLQGLRSYDYSGPNIRGLADLLPAMGNFQDVMGPSRRHLERQGGNFSLPPGLADMPDLPPGIDTRNAIAGPNVAPGNVDTGFALGQAPGIPAQAQGMAEGQRPHTQGWRNVAPGYSAAAQFGYGTPEFEQRLRGDFGRPSAIAGGPEQRGPGAGGGQAAGGGGAAKSTGGPTPVKAGGPAEPAVAVGGGAGKPGAPAAGGGGGAPGSKPLSKGGTSPLAKKDMSAQPKVGAAGNPRTTSVTTSSKTGITKTVSKGGGEGKYVNLTVGKNTTPKQIAKAIAKAQDRPGLADKTGKSPLAKKNMSSGQSKSETDTSNGGAGQPVPAAPAPAKKGSTKPKNTSNTTNGVPNWKLG